MLYNDRFLREVKIECVTKSPSQTQKLGGFLAEEVLTSYHFEKNRHKGDKFSKTKISFADNKKILQSGGERKKAFLIGLRGDLGGGKTTFLQGFARGLGIKQKILSPTFVIMKKFQIPGAKSQINSKFQNFYHIDCYRIQKPKEVLDLGLKKIITSPKNIVAIEWADRIRQILPRNTLILKFELISPVRNLQKKQKTEKKQNSDGTDKKTRKIVFQV